MVLQRRRGGIPHDSLEDGGTAGSSGWRQLTPASAQWLFTHLPASRPPYTQILRRAAIALRPNPTLTIVYPQKACCACTTTITTTVSLLSNAIMHRYGNRANLQFLYMDRSIAWRRSWISPACLQRLFISKSKLITYNNSYCQVSWTEPTT